MARKRIPGNDAQNVHKVSQEHAIGLLLKKTVRMGLIFKDGKKYGLTADGSLMLVLLLQLAPPDFYQQFTDSAEVGE